MKYDASASGVAARLRNSPDRNAEVAILNSNPHASQDQELRTDRSLTYFDDVEAIKVSLQLMQKRSGVPLLRFMSTFKAPPLETPCADSQHAGGM
jgi:hypothetical protein